jgi:hypothetical protein
MFKTNIFRVLDLRRTNAKERKEKGKKMDFVLRF